MDKRLNETKLDNYLERTAPNEQAALQEHLAGCGWSKAERDACIDNGGNDDY